jgi:hypothetical protein
MTENHGYNTPGPGTSNWDQPINDNFSALDRDVELRDREAALGDYTPTAGAKFLATDTGRVYLGNGSDWEPLEREPVSDPVLGGSVGVFTRDAGGVTYIDPDETSTPVGDAIELLEDGGGGEIRLPPRIVFDDGPIRPVSNTSIVGYGATYSGIAIGERNTDGIRFDRRDGVSQVYLDRFTLNTAGLTQTSGVAIRHRRGNVQDLRVGHLAFWGWNNSIYRVAEDVGPFQCRHGQLTIYDCDAGAEDGLLEFRSDFGPANWFGTIAAYPRAGTSGRDSTIFHTRGGTQTVEYITVGGSAGTVVDQRDGSHLDVEHVHWEPTDQQSRPDAIVRLSGWNPGRVDSVKHVTGTADYAYRIDADGGPPRQKSIGTYTTSTSQPRLRENVVDLAAPCDPDRPSFYAGTPADVDVTHGGQRSGGLRALGTAGVGL